MNQPLHTCPNCGAPATTQDDIEFLSWHGHCADCAMRKQKTCTYPKCNCPFDAPDDNFLCARGLKMEQRNGKN